MARAVSPDDRSAAILRAAFEVFTAEGFASARMEDIAARARITKGLIYFYYKNKQELFEATLEEYIRKPILNALFEADPAESMAQRLERVLDEFYSALAASEFFGKLVRLVLMEGQRFPALHESYFRRMLEPTLRLVRECLEEGARRGEWRREAVPEFTQILLAPCILFGAWNLAFARYQSLDAAAYIRDHKASLMRSLGVSQPCRPSDGASEAQASPVPARKAQSAAKRGRPARRIGRVRRMRRG